MKKLSKSELSTSEMEERARLAGEVLAHKRCLHFAVGTHILSGNRRGLIIAEGGIIGGPNLLRVRWEDDGSEEEIAPIALNR